MKIVEIKTQADRNEAQRLKTLNQYPTLIGMLDDQAAQRAASEQRSRSAAKTIYIIGGVVLGVFVLGIVGMILIMGLMSGLQGEMVKSETLKRQASKTTTVLFENEGPSDVYVDSAERLNDNGGRRIEDLSHRFESLMANKEGYTHELKEIYFLYNPDRSAELRNRFVAVFELTGENDTRYFAMYMDNVKYDSATDLELGLGDRSHYNDSGDYGMYTDHEQLLLQEVKCHEGKFDISIVKGGEQ